MPILEYQCTDCGKREQRLVWPHLVREEQWCEACLGQLELIPSRPASVRVGKYGKAGGLNASTPE